MLTNTAVTIYNKYVSGRAEKWQRHVISAALWESAEAVARRGAAAISSNKAVIAVPFSEGVQYYPPKVWRNLEGTISATRWTLNEGDVIVRGSVADEIVDAVIDTETGEVITPAFTMSNLRAKYDEVLEIVSVSRMDQGSPNTHHWLVGCK